jgi:hypothetical protein
MKTEELLDFFVQTINSTEQISSVDFNNNKDVKKAFLLVSDEATLQEAIEREQPNNYNKFCSLTGLLMRYIETTLLDLELANNYINKIENYYTKNWEKIDLVRNSVKRDNIELAKKITAEIPDEDSGPAQYVAERHILEYYAKNGDIEHFKDKIKPSKLSKFPKYGIEVYKYKLVEGYSRKNGIEKTFSLLEDKYFEKTASISALRCLAQTLTLDEIDYYLQTYPRILNETASARADLYVLHFSEQRPIEITQTKFERTLIEILKQDKDVKAGDMRFRDSLLLDLGSSTVNKKQALECKKHIISPSVKRELNYGIKYYEENNKYIS